MRKYSDKFIEEQIAKIDEIHERCSSECPLGPDLSDHPYKEKEMRELLKHRSELSFIKGFWLGWALREGARNE
jgi:hypothetical protein